MKWTKESILTVISTVMDLSNEDYKVVNNELGNHFGISSHAVKCSRVSIMRCLQGFEPSSEKGDKKGFNFGKLFTETVNEWYSNYEGGLSRNALAIKFN